MELKWTSKALADLARLHEFLAPVNKPAATHAVQALVRAPTTLLTHPHIGEMIYVLRLWHTREDR
jgi:plasmid stabilization system protein ParE